MKPNDKHIKKILTLSDGDKLPDDTFTKIVYDALKSSLSGVAIMDLDGSIKWTNSAFTKMFGTSEKSQLIGRQLSELFTSPNIHEIEDIKKTIDQSKRTTAEFRIKDEEGNPGYIELYYSDVQNYSGEVVGEMVSIHDITHRKLLEQHLRQTSAKLVDAQEAERRRVAQELHDSVGASLASLKFAVEEWAQSTQRQNTSARKEPLSIIKKIQHIINEVHHISKNLHPAILHDLGFNTAIHAFCREMQESSSAITILLHLDIPDADIPEKLKIVLYRVIQEGVTNAIRHADPETIDVRLSKYQNSIELVIKDDGKGFDPKIAWDEQNKQKGMGLRNIQDRAEIYEGIFEMDSTIGQGTVLKFNWPLMKE
jgi:PAS domain S-box-containing protein